MDEESVHTWGAMIDSKSAAATRDPLYRPTSVRDGGASIESCSVSRQLVSVDGLPGSEPVQLRVIVTGVLLGDQSDIRAAACGDT